jgi:hypothetical protein
VSNAPPPRAGAATLGTSCSICQRLQPRHPADYVPPPPRRSAATCPPCPRSASSCPRSAT